MKKFVFIISCLLTAQFSFAQPQRGAREKPPSKAEFDQMMKDVQKEMDSLSPEDKKQMEKMGIKLPALDLKALEKVTEADIKKGFEDGNRIVPKRDAARIASISKSKLTDATMGAYLQKTHALVLTKLSASSKTEAEKLITSISKRSPGGQEASNTAVGLWINGNFEMALYLMGKACLLMPTNVDCLNNFASFLTTAGGEELAIPILEKLKLAFPNNSTVLNNLGQAWFGLGDLAQAEDALNRALRVSPNDSQANLTKSLIEQNKGNTPAAIDALKKSIKQTYSHEKEQKLERLGYKLKPVDIDWTVPKKDDGLGMGRFMAPPRPKTVHESALLAPEWEEFIKTVDAEITRLKKTVDTQRPTVEKELLEQQKLMLRNAQNNLRVRPFTLHANKAKIKWGYLQEENLRRSQVLIGEYSKASQQVIAWKKELANKERDIRNVFEPQMGEGRSNPVKAYCEAINTVRNDFLEKSNALLQAPYDILVKHQRRALNDQLYVVMYSVSEGLFEQAKLTAQADALSLLKGGEVQFQSPGPFCDKEKPKGTKKFKLADWEVLNCPGKTSMSVMCIGTMTFSCAKDTLELSPCELPVGLSYEKSNLKTHSTAEFYVGKDIGTDTTLGPVAVELKLEGKIGGSIEIDETGVTDIAIKASGAINVEASNEASHLKIGGSAAEASVRYGMKSGPTGELKILGR